MFYGEKSLILSSLHFPTNLNRHIFQSMLLWYKLIFWGFLLLDYFSMHFPNKCINIWRQNCLSQHANLENWARAYWGRTSSILKVPNNNRIVGVHVCVTSNDRIYLHAHQCAFKHSLQLIQCDTGLLVRGWPPWWGHQTTRRFVVSLH